MKKSGLLHSSWMHYAIVLAFMLACRVLFAGDVAITTLEVGNVTKTKKDKRPDGKYQHTFNISAGYEFTPVNNEEIEESETSHYWELSCPDGTTKTGNPGWSYTHTFDDVGEYALSFTATITVYYTKTEEKEDGTTETTDESCSTSSTVSTTVRLYYEEEVPQTCTESSCADGECPVYIETVGQNAAAGGMGFMLTPPGTSNPIQHFTHTQGFAEATFDYPVLTSKTGRANAGLREKTYGNSIRYVQVAEQKEVEKRPEKISVELLQYGPILYETPQAVFFDASAAQIDEFYRFSLPVDATRLPTGSYEWRVRLTRYYSGDEKAVETVHGTHGLFNNQGSPIARGWVIGQMPRLLADGEDVHLLFRGMHRFYQLNGKWTIGNTYNVQDYFLKGDWNNGFTLTSKDRSYYVFDEDGRIISEADSHGRVTRYEYNDEGRLSKKITPTRQTTEFRYDKETGYLKEVVNPQGLVTSYVHDNEGRIVSIINPGPTGNGMVGCEEHRFAYNSDNLVSAYTTPNGETTRYEYDHAKRLSKIIYATGLVESYVSPITAGLVDLSAETGTQENPIPLIPLSDIVGQKTVEGKTTITKYDRWGNPTEITDPLGNKEYYVRNEKGQILEKIVTAMDGEGKPVPIKTSYEYDKRSNLVKETLPRDRGSRTWEYDPATNAVTRYVAETGLITLYEIDPKTGNTAKETVLAGSSEDDYIVTRYSYSQPSRSLDMLPGGLLLASIDPVGYVTGNAYDLKGNLLERFQYAEDGEEHVADGNGMWKIEGLTSGKRYEVFATWTNAPQNTSRAVFSVQQEKKDGVVFPVQINQKAPPQRHVVGSLSQQEDYQSVGQVTVESSAVQIKAALADKATGNIAGGKIRLIEIETLASYRYDENNRMVEQADANGVKTEYVYDDLGRRVKTIRADGQTTEVFYDFAGRVAYSKNNLGIISGTSFDSANRSVEAFYFNPDAVSVEVQPVKKNDNSVEWTAGNLDPNKRYEVLVSWTAKPDNPTDAILTVKYGAAGFKTTVDQTINPGIHPFSDAGYRSLGTFGTEDGIIYVALNSERNVATGTLKILEVQSLARYEYDLEGQMVASTDRFGNTTRYEYDKLGRRTKTISSTTDPKRPESVSETIYDQAGNPWKQIDPYEYVTENVHDPFGQVVRVIQTDNDHRGTVRTLVTQNEYDKFGRLVKTTDPAGRITEQKYDLLGRRIETIKALGHSQKTEYDKKGRVIAEIDAAQNRTEHVYNLRGQRIAAKLPKPSRNEDSPVSRRNYNTAGQLIGSISPTGRVDAHLYDEYGRSTATYLGLLLEKPTRVDEGKSIYTFEHLFPYESYCVFASWTNDPTKREAAGVRVLDIHNGNINEVYAGTLQSSDKPKNDPWLVPFNRSPYQRLGDNIEPRGNTISVQLEGGLKNVSVYLLRVTPMSRTAYNEKGQVQSRTDARGYSVFYTYDAFGRQISALRDGDENHCCSEGKTFYNDNGQTLATLSPDGRLTILGYDALGRQNKSYLGYLTEVKTGSYTLEGLPLGEEFDLYVSGTSDNKSDCLTLGSLTLVKQKTFTATEPTFTGTLAGQGHVAIVRKLPIQESKFDFAGRTVATLDAKQNETLAFYDSLGRQVVAIQPAVTGMQTRLATHRYFDEAGNMVGQVLVPVDAQSLNAAGERRVTRMEHDLLGRVVKVIQPSPTGEGTGPIAIQEYDVLGNLVKTIDPLGHETRYAYDNLRHRIGEKNAEGGITRFTFDGEGRMTSLTDPVDNTTSWSFGMSGRIAAEHVIIDNAHLDRSFFYDVMGNIISKVDRNGRITEYTFDKLNRHTSEVWYEDYVAWKEKKPVKVFKTTYNRAGKMATMDDGDNRFEFAYGVFDNEIYQKQTLTGLETPIEFEYGTDIAGLRTQYQAKVDGKVDHVNSYEFDSLGRTVSISQTGEGLVSKSATIVYDEFGQLTLQSRFEEDKSVADTTNTFDSLGRIVNISHTKGDTVFADYDISWDDGNRITDFDFTYLNGPPKNKSRYEYDKTSQLIAAKYDFMEDEVYRFDPNGNRINAEIQGQSKSYETGAYNRLLSANEIRYEFDDEGNRISKVSDAETTKYFWDNRNRLVKVELPDTTIEYVYDYKNRLVRRIQNENNAIFVHDGWQIVMQFDGKKSQLLGTDLAHRYLWGTKQDELLCDNEGWVLGDHLNTVRNIVKSDASVVARLEYNAFGRLLSATGDKPWFRYTGKILDDETELQWNINRWYDGSLGRWISDDPIGFRGGDFNLCRYNENSPIRFVDTNGLGCKVVFNCTLETKQDRFKDGTTLKIGEECYYKCTEKSRALVATGAGDQGNDIVADCNDVPKNLVIHKSRQAKLVSWPWEACKWECPSDHQDAKIYSTKGQLAAYADCSQKDCRDACDGNVDKLQLVTNVLPKNLQLAYEAFLAVGGAVCKDFCNSLCQKP